MKLTIDKEILLENVKKIRKVINLQSPNLILKNIKLTYVDGKMQLLGSNDLVTTICIIDCNSNDEEYGALMDCQMLLSSLNKINTDLVELKSSKQKLVVCGVGNKRKFTLNTIDVSEYPSYKGEEMENSISIYPNKLLKAIRSTFEMTSKKQTKPILTSINIKGKKGDKELVFYATDSYRLAKIKINIINELEKNININMPYSFATYLQEIISKEDEEPIELFVGKREMKFKYKNQIIKSRMISGMFPDVKRLINDGDNTNVLEIKKDYIQDIIDCSVFKLDSNYIINFKVNSDGKLIVSNKEKELGEFSEEYNDILYSGNEFEISFNGEYLKQAFKTFDSEILRIKFSKTPLRPFTIYGIDNESDNSLVQLLLPVKTY